MREMKDSGIEWIGMIPDNQQVVKGKYLYSIKTGKLDVNAEDPDGEYPFFTCSMFPKRINTSAFDCEALLVAGNGLVGYTQYYHGKFNAYQRTYVLSDFTGVYPGYLKHYVSNCLPMEISEKSVGSVIQFIKLGDLQNFHVVLPDIEKQRLIADYLDEKCQVIERLIAGQERIVEKLNEYRTAKITEIVTNGTREGVKMKSSNINWLESFPIHWSEYRIANLYEQTSETGDEQLPILTVSINSGISDRELDDSEKDRVFVRSEDRTKYKRVKPGDLVYNMMRAWQGAFGAVRVDGMVSPAYITCRPKECEKIDSRYIEYLFRTPIAIEEMHRYSHGVADFRLRLYWPEFKNIRLCLPPIEEQVEIADYVDSLVDRIAIEIRRRESMIEKLQQYKKSLIYEVVTGKKEVL